MGDKISVDADALRKEVSTKYREVAINPDGEYDHFHTGRPLAARLGYDSSVVDALPDVAVESFSGVGNPFSQRPLANGERVVDCGSGAGFDSFIAADQVGPNGRVVGVDMTEETVGQIKGHFQIDGLRKRDLPRGLPRGDAGRRRLGRRGDKQRGDQPLCRQEAGLRRNPPGIAAGRTASVCGYCQ